MHVFAGANAQGKTNFLEAVYLLATGRSPRTNQESDLIRWDAENALAHADFTSKVRGDFAMQVTLGRRTGSDGRRTGGVQKRLKVNDVARALTDIAGLVPVVLFLVDDLEIIRGEPARRRAFLDLDLATMSRTYAWALRQYARVLDQRNRLLKDIRDGQGTMDDLAPWNHQLATFGGRVMEMRLRFVDELNTVTVSTYQGLTGSSQGMTIEYRREWGDPVASPKTRDDYAALLIEAIEGNVMEEMRRGSSLVGPHRDDLHFLIDEKDVRQYGSQGEQRTAALALRVSEFTLQHRLVGEAPVLLLDDILSELDRSRRAALLEHLAPIAQVIVTTTDVDAIGLPDHASVQQYRVEHGEIKRLK